jgi:DNA-binding MarR family transcriptional regulator
MSSPDAINPHTVATAVQLSIGRFTRRVRQVPMQGGFSTAQISALAHLDRAGSATPGELAKTEQITPQGMGTILAGLEQAGLVDRRPDPADGRRVVMSVSPAGAEVLRENRGARTDHLAVVLAGNFTAAELQTLLDAAALIERLTDGI